MVMIRTFDLSSGFTLFFFGLAILFILLGILLTRVAPKKGNKGVGVKYDDRVIDRNRELID